MKRPGIIIAAAVLLLGCTCCRMKVSRPMLKMLVEAMSKPSEALFYADSCRNLLAVPYVEGGDEAEVMDIYYADEAVRKNAVLVDIHGGFYIGGRRESNRAFASVFLRAGYDVVLVEYRLNDGKRDVSDEISDCAAAIAYLVAHSRELDLNPDAVFLTGDSAGGHLALYLAERHFTPRAVLLNCPAYDFASFVNTDVFTASALTWFMGPNYKDTEYLSTLSPRTFIKDYSGPMFLSTCTNDFIRGESLKLLEDRKALGLETKFVDIESADRKVGHVHNVTDPSLPESRKVNAAMIEFMSKH